MIAESIKAEIDGMSQYQMAEKWRFAPSGSYLFQGEAGDYFKKKFSERGGFTPSISKSLGWEK